MSSRKRAKASTKPTVCLRHDLNARARQRADLATSGSPPARQSGSGGHCGSAEFLTSSWLRLSLNISVHTVALDYYDLIGDIGTVLVL